MREISHEEIAVTMTLKRFVVHTDPWMLNIIGIRSENQKAGKWDDAIIFFRYNGKSWDWLQADATTDPGLYYLQNPMREEGTIIMVPGQYLDLYFRSHHKTEEAFRQKGSALYVRDNNRDKYLDLSLMKNPKNIFSADDVYTNLHNAHNTMEMWRVGKFSAGCQVVNKPEDFATGLKWGDEQVEHTGINSFHYTLLLESELQTF